MVVRLVLNITCLQNSQSYLGGDAGPYGEMGLSL